MATINSIEQRILQMDGGEFQKLCDAYLSASGYGNPNSSGSVAGSNKVKKGTPDTFFELPNEKLAFAEYTTQQKGLFKKLSDDLIKCFNEKKTGVPVSKLEEIVICYTSQLEPNEVLSLKSRCKQRGVKLTLFGISALSNDLLHHPLLIRNFLNLAIDTGQVIPLESFPAVYGKSKFATTLETKFHFREKEIETLSNALESNDLIVISGKAGVGKSRFALEGCRNFIAKHLEFQAYSIVSQSQNLYDDLQERFSLPGQFLILVDDANRVINFSYFMYILRTQKDNQCIKIVVTVRDYALDKIENDISNYHHQSIELDRFTDDQIKELAKDEFSILNSLYLERIVDISGGNPRIAMMISKVAVEKNNLQSINDVSALYDEYFSSIKEDLKYFEESHLLQTAGIIAFLRVVDRTNEQMMTKIDESFHISPDIFWNCAFRLHKLEMVDIYEDQVVRISDQVLSTYLFYLTFFKEKLLDFSDILQNYFPGFRPKIIDALNPTLRAFDQEAIYNLIRPSVQKIWENLEMVGDDENRLTLAESFWHLIPSTTLALIKKRLYKPQFSAADFSQLEQLDSNKRHNISMITELKILGYFGHSTPELTTIALEILFDYLALRPAELIQALHILVDNYSFDRYTALTDASLQQKVLNMLWERSDKGRNELFSRLFIAVAEEYLKTRFETNEMRSAGTITFYTFDLQPNPEIFSLRNGLFSNLFELYRQVPYQDVVFSLLSKYANNNYQISQTKIIENDSVKLLAFIQTDLSPHNYDHNLLVNHYLDFLENHKLAFDGDLRKKFQNDAFSLYQLLSENRKELIQYQYEEYQRIRKERFISYFASFSDPDIKHFIDLCQEIGSGVKQNHDRYEIISGLGIGLSVLAETRPDLFEIALSYYLQQGDKLNLNPYPFVQSHMMIYGKEKTFSFFNQLDYPTKKRWMFGFYQVLPPDKIDANDLPALYKLIEGFEHSQLPNSLEFLVNYVPFDHHIVAKAAQLILDKGDPKYSAWILNSITNPYSEINKQLIDLFKDDIETLKKVYLTVRASGDHDDYNSATLSKILKLDPKFIVEYIEWIYTPKGENSRWYYDSQDYAILWRLQNYHEIFNAAIQLVYGKEGTYHWFTELRQFFISNEEKRLDADIEQKQEELLAELISTYYQDMDFTEFLFEVIVCLPKEKQSRLVFTFLQHDKSFANFKRLALEPRSMSWSGSAVPIYQERIDFFKSLLPMLDNAQLLEHRVYIQQRIDSLEYQKSMEKKRDFIGEDYS